MIVDPQLKHLIQTPTATLTSVGYTCLLYSSLTKDRRGELAAYLALGLAGAGVAMALGAEVERKGEKWGWKGLFKSLRSPSRYFWPGFLGHLFQFLTAVCLALKWYKNEKG